MAKYFVSGSTRPTDCSIGISLGEAFESVNVTLGIQEILTALDDVLNDVDVVSEKDFQKLVNMAHDILAAEVLRDADRQCRNCDQYGVTCENCDLFAKLNGHISFNDLT